MINQSIKISLSGPSNVSHFQVHWRSGVDYELSRLLSGNEIEKRKGFRRWRKVDSNWREAILSHDNFYYFSL